MITHLSKSDPQKKFLNMKTKKEIKEKEFDTVATFRKIKDQISNDLTGRSFKQIKEYLRVNSLKIHAN